MSTQPDQGPHPAQSMRVASLREAGEQLRELAARAHDDGVTVVLTGAEDDAPVAAVVPIDVLAELTTARITAVAEAALAHDTDAPGRDQAVPHTEAMARLGRDEHGRPLRAA